MPPGEGGDIGCSGGSVGMSGGLSGSNVLERRIRNRRLVSEAGIVY